MLQLVKYLHPKKRQTRDCNISIVLILGNIFPKDIVYNIIIMKHQMEIAEEMKPKLDVVKYDLQDTCMVYFYNFDVQIQGIITSTIISTYILCKGVRLTDALKVFNAEMLSRPMPILHFFYQSPDNGVFFNNMVNLLYIGHYEEEIYSINDICPTENNVLTMSQQTIWELYQTFVKNSLPIGTWGPRLSKFRRWALI